MMEKISLLLIVGVLSLSGFHSVAFGQNDDLQIELTYPNGDRVSLANIHLVITSNDGSVNQELVGTSDDHYFITQLPVDLRYEMLVYVNDMLAGTKYISLNDKTDSLIKIPINPSVGMKFTVYYDDEKTPIKNALLELYSHDGNLIKSAITDNEGKTLRFWVSSTFAESDYYIAKVLLSDSLVFESTKLRLDSGSSNFDIVTHWPSLVDFIQITSNLETYQNYSSDKPIIAKIFNENLEKSATFVRKSVHIPELRVGEYQVWIYPKNIPSLLLANQTIVLSENYGVYDIPILNPDTTFDETPESTLQTESHHDLSKSYIPPSFDWTKQSSSGKQIQNIGNDIFLRLITEGDGNAVFTRSSLSEININDKKITISYYVDDVSSLEQFWIYFSHDDFDSWYTYKIPVSDIVSGKLMTSTFQISDFNVTGNPDLTKISQMQIRIMDDSSKPVTVDLFDFSIENKSFDTTTDVNYFDLRSCNCVAFRLDDIQDFFLSDVQMTLIETFQNNNVDLTIGIIANNIGRDSDMTDFLLEKSSAFDVEFANHGWDHEDFSQFGTVGQEMLLLKSNNKINELFGVTPSVFIPPENKFNDGTIDALKALEFTHFSSELDFAIPPFPLSGQSLYHFPETAFTGELNAERTRFMGLDSNTTFEQVEKSITDHGFAVVTLHPQEFSLFYHQDYQNDVNYAQIEQLELLFSKLQDHGIDTVLISEINAESNQKLLVPQWIKNNAKWWIENRVSTEEFVNSLEFLISNQIIHVSQTEQTEKISSIPNWIKQNISWWVDGHTSDYEFLSATEFLIQNGIIKI